MSEDRWDAIVGKMIDLGAEVADKDRPLIVAYLGKNFSPSSPPPPQAPASPPAAPPAATNAP